MLPKIANAFSVGYRCNADNLLKGLKIRKSSGPFSYMVCDLETALRFISVRFEDFTDVVRHAPETYKYTWNGVKCENDLFFNRKFIPAANITALDTVKRICCWKHHDLSDSLVIEAIRRRCQRVLKSLSSNENTLLVHMTQLKIFRKTLSLSAYCDEKIVSAFLGATRNAHMCILIPLLNYPMPTTLCKVNEQLNLIYYKSNRLGNINDFGAPGIDWYGIMQIISNNYTFK